MRPLVSLLALVAGLNLPASISDASSPEEADVARRVDAAAWKQEITLESYSDREQYILRNSRLKQPAEMIVETDYQSSTGKLFRIASESGPSILLDRVLRPLLTDEQHRSQGEARRQ